MRRFRLTPEPATVDSGRRESVVQSGSTSGSNPEAGKPQRAADISFTQIQVQTSTLALTDILVSVGDVLSA